MRLVSLSPLVLLPFSFFLHGILVERQDHSLKARLNDILCKPFIILALEPMLQAVTLYMSFVYGVVYLLFEAYPFVVSVFTLNQQ